METIALLIDQEAMDRLAEAKGALAAGEFTTGEEMAAIMARRRQQAV